MAVVAKRTWTHAGATKTAWVVRYTDQGGKRRTVTCKSMEAARKERIRIETEILHGSHTAMAATATVKTAAEQWVADIKRRAALKQMSATTAAGYSGYVRRYLIAEKGSQKLTQITGPALQSWFDDLQLREVGAVQPPTLVRIRLVTSQVLAFAQRRGWLMHNPMKTFGVKIPSARAPKEEFLDKEIVRTVLATATGEMAVIANTLVFTGLRSGELRALTWRNVDFTKGVLRVRQAASIKDIKDPKTKAGIRDVPLAPRVSALLREWKLQTCHIPPPPREAMAQRWRGRTAQVTTVTPARRWGVPGPRPQDVDEPLIHLRTAEGLAQILTEIERGAYHTAAARAGGMSWGSFYQWRLADPTVASLYQDARALNRRHRNVADYCFPSRHQHDQPVRMHALEESWRGLLVKAGLDQLRKPDGRRRAVHLHLLRHVAASLWIEAGLPPKRIQNLMGHASIQVTFDTYGHLFEDHDTVAKAVAGAERSLVG